MRNATDGLRLMSSLKFSGAFFLFLFSASHFSLVHVIWTFSGGASTTSSSSSEYRLPIRTKECLSLTSWACECHVTKTLFTHRNEQSNDHHNMMLGSEGFFQFVKYWRNKHKTPPQKILPLFLFLHWRASSASTSGTSAPSLTFARRCMPRCHCHAKVRTSF